MKPLAKPIAERMRRFAPVRQKKLGADECHCWPSGRQGGEAFNLVLNCLFDPKATDLNVSDFASNYPEEIKERVLAHWDSNRLLQPRRSAFLHNHAPHIAAMDLFVLPAIGFTFWSLSGWLGGDRAHKDAAVLSAHAEAKPNDYITCRVNSVDLKNRLSDIETDRPDRLHVWLLVGASTAPTSKALPCRWRSRPQHQKRTNAPQQTAAYSGAPRPARSGLERTACSPPFGLLNAMLDRFRSMA